MNSDSELERYSAKIPDEIKIMLKAIADEDRLGILVALLEKGKMTFSEMKEKFSLNSSSLTNHLSILQKGNLIENFYEKNERKVFSYYDVTDLPEKIFDSILDAEFKPSIEMRSTEFLESGKEINTTPIVTMKRQSTLPTIRSYYTLKPRQSITGT